MDKIIKQIMDSNKWPSIHIPDNLELLNEIADKSFAHNTFEGMLAATLMYHQLIEAMCVHLLSDCHFFIQLSIYPTTIEFRISPDKMFGYYVKELKTSISFHNKDEFIEKVEKFNSYRINVVHKMKKSNLESLEKELRSIKNLFDEIYKLYFAIQDNFRLDFNAFQKNIFNDYLTKE